MPRTTIYIRNADWENWKLVSNKAEMISKAIRSRVDHIDDRPTCKMHDLYVIEGRKTCMMKGCKV